MKLKKSILKKKRKCNVCGLQAAVGERDEVRPVRHDPDQPDLRRPDEEQTRPDVSHKEQHKRHDQEQHIVKQKGEETDYSTDF